MSRDPF